MSQNTILHNTLADPDLRWLGDKVIEAMQRLHAPGVAVGVLYQGQEHVAGFGVTSIENPLPVNADTLFQIGSITKTFVGTAAMRLVEQGKLDLDAPVRAYLPDLRLKSEETTSRVNLRHLFTHTGGWVGDYFNDFGYGDDALVKMMEHVGQLEQLTPLGALYSYNNAGFYIAGRVIEVVTGQPFEAALKALVLDPLGLSMSFFFPHDVISRRFVVGHFVKDGKPEVARPWAVGRAIHPAGGLVSNVRDLLRYAHFHLGDGAGVLTPTSLAAMRQPLAPGGGMTDAVGVTWMLTNAHGHWVVRHGGGTKGQVTEFRMIPAHSFAVTILTNCNEGGELCEEVADWAMKHYLGFGMPEAVPIAMAGDKLDEYVGHYIGYRETCDLSRGEGGLVLQVKSEGGFPTPETPPPPAPPPVRLAFYAEDRIVGLDSPMKGDRGEFLRDPDGRLAWFRFGGRINRRA
jgi:CubicO group peptidase (beta-lactamase class C family)